jgi:hypothetical protein
MLPAVQCRPVHATPARHPQQGAVLPPDLGLDQLPRQPHTDRLVAQGPILTDAALHLASRGDQAGGVIVRDSQPVDVGAVLDTGPQRLGGDLGAAVQQDGIEAAEGCLLSGWPRGRTTRVSALRPTWAPWATMCRVPPRSVGKRRTGSRWGWRPWQTSSGRQTGGNAQRARRGSLVAMGGRSSEVRRRRASARVRFRSARACRRGGRGR